MTTLEDRVREALRADAEAVRPGTIPGVPARPARPAAGRARFTRSRFLIPLAAAAAVIAIVTSLSLTAPYLLSGSPGSGSPSPLPTGPFAFPTGRSYPPASLAPAVQPTVPADAVRSVPSSSPVKGVPRFYVAITIVAPTTTDTVVVRNTATGQITGEIHPQGGSVFAGLAATAGDQTFITAVDPGSGCSPVQLYWFQLNQLGVPGPLEPLHIELPGGVPQSAGALAITPDGDMIAYLSGGCGAPSQGGVGVINLATRQARAWAYSVSGPDILASDVGNLSLSADGQTLAFSTFGGTSVLRTSAPAGSLLAHTRLVSHAMIWGAVAEDGQSLYGCAVSPYRSGQVLPDTGALTYSQISLTGAVQDVIASWANLTSPQCYASMDPDGNYLLVQYPVKVPDASDWTQTTMLDLQTGHLTRINAPAFYGPFDFAW